MAKIAIFLACLVMLVVVEKSFGRRAGRGRAANPCKTDNTCGDNPVIESLSGTDYCCSEGSRIKLRPPKGSMTEARCKCIVARGGGANGRGRGKGRGRTGRCKPENSCGEGAVTDTANGRPVCCPAGQVVNKVPFERRGRTRERCNCQAPEAEAA